MVKHFLKLFILTLCILGLSGCNLDLIGLFTSSDVDERFKEKDNLTFLVNSTRDWSSLSLENDFSFIVLTDTHIEDGETFGLENLAGVITAFNADTENIKIEFAVVLGDITQYGSAQDINKFIEVAEQLTVPCYPVIGNHDVYFGNWSSVWRKKIGSATYRINAGSTTLFMLDSANSFFGKEQLNWLEREIKTAAGKVFVFTHSPLFVTGPAGMQQITDTKERARIVSILKDKCDIMFMGHSHKYYYNEAGNVKYIALEDFIDMNVYYLVTVKSGEIVYLRKTL